ncbi:molybdopterin molybdenumtransferase, partial [Nocardia cyriacigeorgica]|nr:molybdopterin molybdenumtransferase [Nocardia cyriacigeorgica]
MRSVEDQQIKVTAAAVAPRPVRVAIYEAHGRRCGEDRGNPPPQPRVEQAAIDGYAVRSVDVASAGAEIRDEEGELVDLTLPVVGEVVAGSRQPIRLQPRQTVRVDTGAPLPTLADAVLPIDFTDGGRARIKVYEPVRSGDYV